MMRDQGSRQSVIGAEMPFCGAVLGGMPEVCIRGSRLQLLALAQLIARGGDARTGAVPADFAYPIALTGLCVEHAVSERVSIAISRERLSVEIRGEASKLEILADNVRFVAEMEAGGSHVHIEYVPDHFYLDSGSVPLVVELTP